MCRALQGVQRSPFVSSPQSKHLFALGRNFFQSRRVSLTRCRLSRSQAARRCLVQRPRSTRTSHPSCRHSRFSSSRAIIGLCFSVCFTQSPAHTAGVSRVCRKHLKLPPPPCLSGTIRRQGQSATSSPCRPTCLETKHFPTSVLGPLHQHEPLLFH
jgi:hypothetical protein